MSNFNKLKKYYKQILICFLTLLLLINIFIFKKINNKLNTEYDYDYKVIKLVKKIEFNRNLYLKNTKEILKDLKKYCSIKENDEENKYILKCYNLTKKETTEINNILFLIHPYNIISYIKINKKLKQALKDNNINIYIKLNKGLNIE